MDCKPKTQVTQNILRQLLSYDPLTGIFTRLKRTSMRINVGQEAGYLHKDGGVQISVLNKEYKAHRLAWLYMTGEWPEFEIDHINGNRSDNRWENLRDIKHAINLQNRRKPQTNNRSTGLLGVYPNKKRYRAVIATNGKSTHLGTFDTPDGAHEAYLKAKRKFHAGCTI